MEGTRNTLYKITGDLEALDGCLDGEEKEEAIAYVQSLLDDKIDGVVGYNRYLEDTLLAIDKRIAELLTLKKSMKKKQANFAEYVTYCLDQIGASERVGTLERVVIPKPSKVVEILDEGRLPMEFVQVKRTVTPNKKEIKRHLAMGKMVNGARLIDGKRCAKFKPIKVNSKPEKSENGTSNED